MMSKTFTPAMLLLALVLPVAAAVEAWQAPGHAVAIDAHGTPVVIAQAPPLPPLPPRQLPQAPPVVPRTPTQATTATQHLPPLDHWPTREEASQPEAVLPPELARQGQIVHAPTPAPSEPLFRKEVLEPAAAKPTPRPVLARHGTDLLILTSAAFLFPAHTANRKGLSWISFLFATQAVVCGIYHYCDQHRFGTALEGPVCSDATYRVTHLTDHGMAYFVMLQMGLLILGPEDPTIQRIVPNCCGTSSDFSGLPLHVVVLTRACPSGLVALLLLSAARGDHAIGSPAFHIALGLLCCSLLFSAKGIFWLLRPMAAAKALALPQSWLRLMLCMAAVTTSIFLFLAMQTVANDDTKVGMGGAKAFAHSAWHVAAAGLAGVVLEALNCSRLAYAEGDFQGLLMPKDARPERSET